MGADDDSRMSDRALIKAAASGSKLAWKLLMSRYKSEDAVWRVVVRYARESSTSHAFALIYRHFEGPIWARAYSNFRRYNGELADSRSACCTEQEARDAVQITFDKAHRSLATFEGRAKLGTWLKVICHNACTDMERKRRDLLEGRIHAPDAAPGHQGLSFFDGLIDERNCEEHRETLLDVEAVLDEFPAIQRKAFELAYFSDIAQGEVAAYLGVRRTTMTTWLAEIRKRIDRALADTPAALPRNARRAELCGVYHSPLVNAIVVAVYEEDPQFSTRSNGADLGIVAGQAPASCDNECRCMSLEEFHKSVRSLEERSAAGLTGYSKAWHDCPVVFYSQLESVVPADKRLFALIENAAVQRQDEVNTWSATHPRWTFQQYATHSAWVTEVRTLLHTELREDWRKVQRTIALIEAARPFIWTYNDMELA